MKRITLDAVLMIAGYNQKVYLERKKVYLELYIQY